MFTSYDRYIVLGVVIALFFQCMNALLNPADHQSTRIKWPLVAHTVATFLFATVLTVTDLDMLSTSFINNREFPGHGDDVIPPGPVGYMISLYSNVFDIVPRIMFLLNHCLADGLLVSPTPNSVAQVPNVGHSSSSIAVVSFMK